MKINDINRPKEITSNEIWELYKLLDKLAPFVFGVLKGELTADDAILGIEHVILNEAG